MGEKRKKYEKREMFFNLCENYNRLMSESRGGWGDGAGIRTWWNVMKLMSWDYTMTACRYDINGEGGGNGSGSSCCASLHCLNVKSEREWWRERGGMR